jgi:hypothetical protein
MALSECASSLIPSLERSHREPIVGCSVGHGRGLKQCTLFIMDQRFGSYNSIICKIALQKRSSRRVLSQVQNGAVRGDGALQEHRLE